MGETIELTDIVLRVIGAFYAFGGYVATRAGLMSRFLDQAIAAIAMKKPTASERAQNAWLLATAALVLTGGVLLLAGLQLAAWVFALSTLGQIAYIYYLAPRFFDKDNEPDADGRRATSNALVLYAAATAFILWAAYRGRLVGVEQASTPALIAVAAALLLYAGYVARALWWTPRASAGGQCACAVPPTMRRRVPPHESKRIKVMADYYCDPLWALDEDLLRLLPARGFGPVGRVERGVPRLGGRLMTLRSAQMIPATSLWSDAEHAAHAAEGRHLAVRLKRERPDLMVYVLEADTGVVEIHADEAT